MAVQTVFACRECGYEVEAWDEGNPYIEGPDGRRHHFYHPCGDSQIAGIVRRMLGHEPSKAEIRTMLETRSGNEPEHVCLDCGDISLRNEQEAGRPCAACGGTRVTMAWRVAGKSCPACRTGTFDTGRMGAIS